MSDISGQRASSWSWPQIAQACFHGTSTFRTTDSLAWQKDLHLSPTSSTHPWGISLISLGLTLHLYNQCHSDSGCCSHSHILLVRNLEQPPQNRNSRDQAATGGFWPASQEKVLANRSPPGLSSRRRFSGSCLQTSEGRVPSDGASYFPSLLIMKQRWRC